MTDDLIIYIAGMLGIIGCYVFFVADERHLRRTRMTENTGATRLLDGERFPAALSHFEGDSTCTANDLPYDANSSDDSISDALPEVCLTVRTVIPVRIATRRTARQSQMTAHRKRAHLTSV